MESILVLSPESLTCSICYEILSNPQECNNCHNLFCDVCIKDYLTTKDKYRRVYYCPLCRNKKNNFKENNGVNNIINDLIMTGKKMCYKCDKVFDNKIFKSHIDKCWIKCIKCHKIFINEEKFLKHFENHGKNEMDKIVNVYFNKKFEKEKKINEDDFGKIKREKFEDNLISSDKNSKNNPKSNNSALVIDKNDYIPKYDLYFCGKINNIKCSCCVNKKCSPNGELCINCMKKNLKLHGLKKHYLINKSGKACKYSHGSFHCNSKFEEIKQDKGGNFYKSEKICKGEYICDACKYITKLMNYYLPTEVIKKLIERDK